MYLRILATLVSLAVVIWAVTQGQFYALFWLGVPGGMWLDHFKVRPAVQFAALACLFVPIGIWALRDMKLLVLWEAILQEWLLASAILFLPLFFGLYAAYVWWEKRQMARK